MEEGSKEGAWQIRGECQVEYGEGDEKEGGRDEEEDEDEHEDEDEEE